MLLYCSGLHSVCSIPSRDCSRKAKGIAQFLHRFGAGKDYHKCIVVCWVFCMCWNQRQEFAVLCYGVGYGSDVCFELFDNTMCCVIEHRVVITCGLLDVIFFC